MAPPLEGYASNFKLSVRLTASSLEAEASGLQSPVGLIGPKFESTGVCQARPVAAACIARATVAVAC